MNRTSGVNAWTGFEEAQTPLGQLETQRPCRPSPSAIPGQAETSEIEPSSNVTAWIAVLAAENTPGRKVSNGKIDAKIFFEQFVKENILDQLEKGVRYSARQIWHLSEKRHCQKKSLQIDTGGVWKNGKWYFRLLDKEYSFESHHWSAADIILFFSVDKSQNFTIITERTER
jgi:hypothetical protein